MMSTRFYIILLPLLLNGCYTVIIHHHRNAEDPDGTKTCELCIHESTHEYAGKGGVTYFGMDSRWYEYYESPYPWWIAAEETTENTNEPVTGSAHYTGRNYGRRRTVTTSNESSSLPGSAVTNGSFIPPINHPSSYSGAISSGAGNSGTTGASPTNPNEAKESSENRAGQQDEKKPNSKREYGRKSTVRKND